MFQAYRFIFQHATGKAQLLRSSLHHRLKNGHLFKKCLTTPVNSVVNSSDLGQVGTVAQLRRSFTPSPAQQEVVDLSRTQNVVVTACPGAGKTATAEAIVAANPDKSILVVTYSKRLQLEVAKRFKNYPWADVSTFHSIAGRLFSQVVLNDIVLRNLRKARTIPAWTGKLYNIIILDEFQDCTDDLFWLTCTLLSSITDAVGGRAPRVVILGDERQAIYAFRGADSRYLSLSSEILSSFSPYPWKSVTLSNSFRLSHQTSAFVNEVFLGGIKPITGSHDGPKPKYVHAELFDINSLAKFLIPLIKKYGPERTAILAPFIRGNEPISSLTNLLSKKHHIKIAVSISDDMPLDDLVLSGKLVVSTYHQFKGNERDLVIVYGVDNGYFKFLGRNLPDDRCPNETFVALTRARKQLVVMHNARQATMPFVSHRALANTAQFVRLSPAKFKRCSAIGRRITTNLLLPQNIFVSDIARHVPYATLDDVCNQYLQITELNAPLPEYLHIKAPERVLTDPVKMYYEAVSDINGLVVAATYELDLLGTLSTLGYKKEDMLVNVPTRKRARAAWLCKEACRYDAIMSGYHSRMIQMAHHSFDWMGPHIDVAKQRLQKQVKNYHKLEFERILEEQDFTIHDQRTRIVGRADIIQYYKTSGLSLSDSLRDATQPVDDGFGERSGPAEEALIWEIKFVSKLSLEHAVQAIVYGYLWAVQHAAKHTPCILLFNVYNGEKWKIAAPGGREGIRCLVEELLREKYSTGEEISTDKFLKLCKDTREEVGELWES